MLLANDLRWALDRVAFVREALGFEPDEWQQAALRSNGKRQIWNVSRQAGKSTIAAQLSLHDALFIPRSLTLMVSPSLRQSSELFRKLSGYLHQLDVQPSLEEDNKLSVTLSNGSRVVSLPSSEATVRGFSGVGRIIEDEASRVSDNLYYAVRPMLATTNGSLLLMSTPFGMRGHFHAEWTEGGDTWERVEVPAERCPRISAEFLAEERRAMGSWWYSQEYECQFREAADAVFHADDVASMFSDDVPMLSQWEAAS
jgi:hypothetical protein